MMAEVGQKLTLIMEHSFYMTLQLPTLTVPEEGFVGEHHEITFQCLNYLVYYTFEAILVAETGEYPQSDACTIITTVTAYGKTINDDPQGEANATITMVPKGTTELPYYLGIWRGKTNPFVHGTSTSLDGGVVIFNVKPREEPYILSATKENVKFNAIEIKCRKGGLVNASPPHGPIVIHPSG
eukprot:TRINITY_DN1110_c0_g1_i3.p1 TRINITY_DN1110_c0_g1~~TRINITY_DN1110_c0_g1_i3.p1  ORF type:complete len:183 (-),score=39.25 TRINITY_DN1110_c0_g1_i3:178-726(-)